MSLATIAGCALLAGCAAGQTMNGDGEGQWETTLIPESGFVGVEGRANVTVLEFGATATATIEQAPEEGEHGWHVHRGECGDEGEIVGSQELYPPLEVGPNGAGEVTAMLEEELDPGENYYVDIHPTPDDTETIVACGDLLRR